MVKGFSGIRRYFEEIIKKMRRAILGCYGVMVILIFSCKTVQKIDNDKLFGPTWELEYLSGPRIAFQGLFKEKKPKIYFEKDTKKVMGNAGCNGYSADYRLNGKSISFSEPGPNTMMYCGEGEQHFLKALGKVDSYRIDEAGKLNLLVGPIPMLRFHKTDE